MKPAVCSTNPHAYKKMASFFRGSLHKKSLLGAQTVFKVCLITDRSSLITWNIHVYVLYMLYMYIYASHPIKRTTVLSIVSFSIELMGVVSSLLKHENNH